MMRLHVRCAWDRRGYVLLSTVAWRAQSTVLSVGLSLTADRRVGPLGAGLHLASAPTGVRPAAAMPSGNGEEAHSLQSEHGRSFKDPT